MKFQIGSLNTFRVMLRTKFKNENEQRAITPKVWSFELWFLCTALLLNDIYLPMKFHVNALHSFKVMLRTKFKNENEQRDITPKVWCLELWFLCTALLLNETRMKFHVDALHNFKAMLRTKKGRTDGLTDGHVDYFTPFGCIKKNKISLKKEAPNMPWKFVWYHQQQSNENNENKVTQTCWQ